MKKDIAGIPLLREVLFAICLVTCSMPVLCLCTLAIGPTLQKHGLCDSSNWDRRSVHNPWSSTRDAVVVVNSSRICWCEGKEVEDGCYLSIDVHIEEGYFGEHSPELYYWKVYHSCHACDATITWLSATEFKIVDDRGGEATVDITQLKDPGIIPDR